MCTHTHGTEYCTPSLHQWTKLLSQIDSSAALHVAVKMQRAIGVSKLHTQSRKYVFKLPYSSTLNTVHIRKVLKDHGHIAKRLGGRLIRAR